MQSISFDVVMGRFADTVGVSNDKAIAECLGMSPTAYSNRKQRGSIPYEELIDYLVTHNMDISSMIFPQNGPYKVDYSLAQKIEVGEKMGGYRAEYMSIPHYNVQAAAGHGAINAREEQLKPLAFRRDWLNTRHLSPANLVIVDVVGDSMEPYLKDRDLVLVDQSQTDIAGGKTYVLRMQDELYVKNLQRLPHGLVQVASFNQGFPPYQIDLKDEALDMSVIGRVVASMHEW